MTHWDPFHDERPPPRPFPERICQCPDPAAGTYVGERWCRNCRLRIEDRRSYRGGDS